jgi:hypothetical protein
MITIFILIGSTVIKCIFFSQIPVGIICTQESSTVFGSFLASGIVEMFFELKGIAKIFRKKRID